MKAIVYTEYGTADVLYLQEFVGCIHLGTGGSRNESRVNRGEAAIWQRRFWEHTIRDEADLNRHRDYIHYNPVKHGLMRCVVELPWSSLHRYVRPGYYAQGWGEAVREDVRRMDCGE